MIEEIAKFYAIAFSIYLLVHIFWRNRLSQLALTWFGPIPKQYEYLSEFKLRKFWYAFGWFLQLIYALILLFVVAKYYPQIEKHNYFLVISFGLTIGLGMSVLASFGFLVSFAKTYLLGPNPYFEFINHDDESEPK